MKKQMPIHDQLLLQASLSYNTFYRFNSLQSNIKIPHVTKVQLQKYIIIPNNRFMKLQENSYKNNIILYYSTSLTMKTT
jgi:hypothetical protein